MKLFQLLGNLRNGSGDTEIIVVDSRTGDEYEISHVHIEDGEPIKIVSGAGV